jgi:hypothetical protein
MSAFVLRDDDLSYWTDINEIDYLYKDLFDKGIKISFATIPKSIRSKNLGDFKTFYQLKGSDTLIHKNVDLVMYIKDLLKKDRIEIMLHGYNHNYYLKSRNKLYEATFENKKNLSDLNQKFKFIGEYNINNFDLLLRKTYEGKQYLEDTFEVKIKNFVPPSNQISRSGIKAITNNKLNLSGLIGFSYDRENTLIGYKTFLKRIIFKLRNNGIHYPYVSDYGKHYEFAAMSITPITDFIRVEKYLDFCINQNLPIQFATHYWELNGPLKSKFFRIINELNKAYESKTLSQII